MRNESELTHGCEARHVYGGLRRMYGGCTESSRSHGMWSRLGGEPEHVLRTGVASAAHLLLIG
jgi:hypothetical protein